VNVKEEIKVYDKATVSAETGEIEEFDGVIFPNVIRRREIDFIESKFQIFKPKRVLDFGCGGGWLSKVLASYGCEIVGVDVSRSLILSAKKTSPTVNFVVGDCINLPFRERSFDAIVGVAILHHLNIHEALIECNRVTAKDSLLLFMEPNKLNPIAALGRKILPMGTHTKTEKPLTLPELNQCFAKTSLSIKEIKYVFFYSFSLARLFRRHSFPRTILPIISKSESLLEEIPLIKFLSATFFLEATKY
jgi:2-polyprenyl-3-methyl-5-hydroxy-6-metoxy-1,4-benzoquinol methylase